MDGSEAQVLDRMFRPRTVAVVGASATPSKIGGIPVAYLKSMGFAGRVIPVNPTALEIQGLSAYPNLAAVPEPVDLAIVAVPAAMVEAAVEDAIGAGVPALVIFSSGFAETGPDGAALQARIAARVRAAGVRMLGPNCLGFMTVAEGCWATFTPVLQLGRPAPGRVGIVSQSGAFGAYALTLARLRGIGLSHWISTGNEADLGFAECVEWMAGDPDTDVIVGYMEGARDGAGLIRAMRCCSEANKPLILCKVGRTEVGAHAAASHTAALAGEDAVFDGVFRQFGVIRANSIEDCFDAAYAAAVAGAPRGRRLGLYTVSGGAGVLMADEAAAGGLDVPELSAKLQAEVLSVVPFAGVRNPLDITGQVLNVEGANRTALDLMARDGTVDTIVSFLAATGLNERLGDQIADDLLAVRAAHPGIAQFAVTVATPAFRKRLEGAGIPVFEDPNRAVRAVAALAAFANRRKSYDAPGEALVDGVLSASTEPEALALLGSAGLPVVNFKTAANPEMAARAAELLQGPLAVKLVSPEILHKAEVGGVRLNVRTPEEAAEATRGILAEARIHAPQARLDGVMLAPMVRGVAEAVIGIQQDPTFGAVIMAGLGGVHVEALRDVAFRAAPIDDFEALSMLHQLRAVRLLTHPRGRGPADLASLAQLIAQVSQIAPGSGLLSLDLNPVIVGQEGEGVTIVDALIEGA